jgi:hypothetical protein
MCAMAHRAVTGLPEIRPNMDTSATDVLYLKPCTRVSQINHPLAANSEGVARTEERRGPLSKSRML